MFNQISDAFGKMYDKLIDWVNLFIVNLPNMIVALIIFMIAYFASRKLKTITERLLRSRVSQASIRILIGNAVSILVIAAGLFLALNILNLDKALTTLLTGAGVVGLAVGLALQGTLSNTFSGIFLSIKDIMNLGDYIETNGYSGKVDEITMRYVKIIESDNNAVIIPNKLIIENPFKNYGLTTRIRTTVECGVGYESDLEAVRDLTRELINDLFPQKNDEKIEFQYLEFGGSSINFQLRFWVEATANLTLLEAKSKAIIAIKKAYDENGINIPFPIRTLVFDNKLKVGGKLAATNNTPPSRMPTVPTEPTR